MKKLLLLLPFILIGCNGADKLPPITQAGLNTFGCTINGKVFVPDNHMDGPNVSAVHLYSDYNLVIYGRKDTADAEYSVELMIDSTGMRTGAIMQLKYKDTVTLGESSAVYEDVRKEGSRYKIVPPLPGMVHILRYDKAQKIIAGTFAFSAINKSGKTVQIKDGRFDLKIQ